jgi:hypothetical protein
MKAFYAQPPVTRTSPISSMTQLCANVTCAADRNCHRPIDAYLPPDRIQERFDDQQQFQDI